jgi:hypothetical protein
MNLTTEVTSSETPAAQSRVAADGLGADRRGEDQDAGVGGLDRYQVEVERGDDPVVAAPAPQRPEEVGLVVGVDRAALAVGGDQLDRAHPVAGEAVAAAEPAQPAAQVEAGDADVGGGARHAAEPVGAGGFAQLEHQRAGGDPGSLCLRIHLDAPHPLGLDQDRALERAQGDGAVAGPLAGDPQVVVSGKADGLGHVVGALDEGDSLGVLVGGEVPGHPRLVPVGVIRGGDAAGDRQPAEVSHQGCSFAVR